MTYNKKSIEDVVISAGQKVFVRCDFNVPMKDGVITSDKRIIGALPTIKYLMSKGAKVILSSHMGKPHAIFTEVITFGFIWLIISEFSKMIMMVKTGPKLQKKSTCQTKYSTF